MGTGGGGGVRNNNNPQKKKKNPLNRTSMQKKLVNDILLS